MRDKLFNPSEAHKLEDPERLEWLPPAEVLVSLGLRPGICVADIGAGTGYFAIPIAWEIGPKGKVCAVDLQEEMLALLRGKLDTPGAPDNIEIVQGSAEATNLPTGSCDLVLLANVWHEFEDHPAALREAARILREAGKIAILDWRTDVLRPPGPPLDHRISTKTAVRCLEQNGWSVESLTNVGRFSYLLLASVADESVQS